MSPRRRKDGRWEVVEGGISINGTFGSEGEALDWIDENTPKPIEDDREDEDDHERPTG